MPFSLHRPSARPLALALASAALVLTGPSFAAAAEPPPFPPPGGIETTEEGLPKAPVEEKTPDQSDGPASGVEKIVHGAFDIADEAWKFAWSWVPHR
ncbi:hypothetical protein [Streptomyces sp. NBC_01465]|uniref:hypothetical protein n=1 Tax=Streptomyces sp. NBC_01465 TaxID=2903878 RepID=UPI002E37EA86|nr:hypothetical protein [Streptomyces sp. NBC_01465]